MLHEFKGERTLMRIFIGELDKCKAGKYKGRPVHEALVEYFRSNNFPGATVTRAVAGFGIHNKMHTAKFLDLSIDLPLVVEVVAREEQIQAALPELDVMIDGGLITLERVRVILYRPRDMKDDEKWAHRIEGVSRP